MINVARTKTSNYLLGSDTIYYWICKSGSKTASVPLTNTGNVSFFYAERREKKEIEIGS
jgi:hypothetical protein